MGAADTNLVADDLYLLAAHFSGPTACTVDALAKRVGSLVGVNQVLSSSRKRVSLHDALTDWQIRAIGEGTVAPHGDSARAMTADPPIVVTGDGENKLATLFGAAMMQRRFSDKGEQYLVARALGLPANAGPQRLKRLSTVGGLRLAIVRRAWKLKVPESATAGQVRNALAARALGAAFGTSVERQIGPDTRLSAKAGRTIAAQLLKRKRRISSDAQLITALAAQHLDIVTGDQQSLRQALIHRHFGFDKKEQSRVDPATLDASEAAVRQVPDGPAFLKAVRSSAKLNANGWSGNRKAYISHVWRSVCDSHPDWRLSADVFKTMLADAHRLGHVVLINADLRDRKNIRDVQDSAVHYKNMEWHYVQIAD